MNIFIGIVIALAIDAVGYLLGSLSTSLIIGKLFFKTDIRKYGSGNAGGTNAGRVLGGKAGAAVILIDILKIAIFHCILVVIFRYTALSDYVPADIAIYIGDFFLVVGHCFPIFYNFRGGKAVSSIAGFTLATNWLLILIAFVVFGLILIWKRMVSLSSIIGTIVLVIGSWLVIIPGMEFSFYPLSYISYWYPIAMTLIGIILIALHSGNIKRIKNGTERKIKWMK